MVWNSQPAIFVMGENRTHKIDVNLGGLSGLGGLQAFFAELVGNGAQKTGNRKNGIF